ncbi:M24 family metallopeptidase [Paenibacillus mendelii]|uniref:M24 family metallopeptidase n=1 Tax=Paenibacillus mendelii TaxID=206163 RepID=A0ABV6JB01_9BACL|nr:Xaa-Pro peptidase family protein [Paenibacillus mendelii]MCQ6562956.1 Xaa-Pro peptidase family protein [Paenibacillus mendelii]
MSNAQPLVFTLNEFQSRLSQFQAELMRRDLKGMLIHTPENIFYLTGYQSPGYYMYQCLVVPASGDPVLVLRRGELSNVQFYSWLPENQVRTYDDTNDPVALTSDTVKQMGVGSGALGIETGSWFLPVRHYLKLTELLGGYQLTDAQGIVESLRVIKSPAEIAYIREACLVADNSMQAGLDAIRAGVNEDEVAAAMFSGMIRSGGEYLGMEPFVSSGYRSGNMHSAWGHKVIGEGETLLLEVAGARNRYHGALMRSAYTGAPTDEIKRVTEVCIASLNAAIESIRPGVTAGEVDEACRGTIERAGLYEQFRKRTGYSIGCAFAPDWGEGHIMSLQRDDQRVLQPGMVFHIPPALRVPNTYGVGFSETLLVTDTGCELLTKLPRELTVV